MCNVEKKGVFKVILSIIQEQYTMRLIWKTVVAAGYVDQFYFYFIINILHKSQSLEYCKS